MRLERRRIDLALRRPWTISRSTSTSKSNVLVRLSHGGSAGLGEGAPNARYGEDWQSVLAALDRIEPLLGDDPDSCDEVMDRVEAAIPEHPAARPAPPPAPGRRPAELAAHVVLHRHRRDPGHAGAGPPGEGLPDPESQ